MDFAWNITACPTIPSPRNVAWQMKEHWAGASQKEILSGTVGQDGPRATVQQGLGIVLPSTIERKDHISFLLIRLSIMFLISDMQICMQTYILKKLSIHKNAKWKINYFLLPNCCQHYRLFPSNSSKHIFKWLKILYTNFELFFSLFSIYILSNSSCY